jgi:hypothetical protein
MSNRNEEHDRQVTDDLVSHCGMTHSAAGAFVAAVDPETVEKFVQESIEPRQSLTKWRERIGEFHSMAKDLVREQERPRTVRPSR